MGGGLTKSFCESGLCMCKFGYKVGEDDDGSETCVAEDSELAAAVARNATQEEISLLMEHKEHSERMVAQNLAIATAWICGAASFAVAASVWMFRRRSSKVAIQPAGYETLIGWGGQVMRSRRDVTEDVNCFD